MHTGQIAAATDRMFRLVTANDAARLADALAVHLDGSRGNPLVPAQVLVPQVGLRRWLEVHLAEKQGVVANIEFTPPARFAWELLNAADPALPRRSPFEVDVLRWHLHALLGQPLDGDALASLRRYLAGDADPLRRHALAGELARVFERMQGYRRDKLLHWERGGSPDDWQAELWRRVLTRTGGVSRAARVEAWLQRFDPEYPVGSYTEKPAPPGLPQRLACFACANVSPDVLRMLAVAGRHCDVDFFLPLPSREYLGDTPRRRSEVRESLLGKQGGNPLVVSQGGALAEFVELLYGYEHVRPDAEIDDFDAHIAPHRDGSHTLLDHVREDILQHAAPSPGRRVKQPDPSLQFHACHTPLREVETLHDALLAMFDADDTLQPRDVAVMMPDVAGYRPAIEAVFGDVDRNDPRFIPFNLGDAGVAAMHPVVQLFLKLLDAPVSRWELDEILDVLAAPGVMRRFDLDADAVERMTRHLREAGVCWGEDERARADCGGYREFSWAFGIDRILAGFACGDVEDQLVGDTTPLEGIEGAAFTHLDAVLAVTHAWRRLRGLADDVSAADVWQRELNEILDALYQPDPYDPAESRALERIRSALEQLADDCHAAGADATPAWPEVRAFLRDALERPDPRQYLFSGGVTFCGMVPLRVVPFRVICLLGMGEDAFPRRERLALDPLLAERRKGDRDVRADDRLLFLQLLSAARDVFYLSWVGRDPHSNASRPASALVAELLDLVKRDYLTPPMGGNGNDPRSQWLPRIEPLHPFAAALYGADGQPSRSYQTQWLPAAVAPARSVGGLAPFAATPLPAAAPPAMLQLDDLKRFLGDPARGYLERALQIQLPRGAEADTDLEPLQPDAPLLRYRLASALLEQGDARAEQTRTMLRAQAQLPPGELADAALAIAGARADLLRDEITAFTGGAARADDIAATLELDDGTRLAGSVAGVHAAGLVRETAGKLNGRRALEAQIDLLFATAATGRPVACRVFWIGGSKGKEKVEQRDLASATPEEARTRLAELVAAMQRGLQAPLPLLPGAAWDALKRWRVRDGEAGATEFVQNFRNAADKADDDNGSHMHSEFTESAVRIAWRGIDFAVPGEALATDLYAAASALLPGFKPREGKR